MSAVSGTAYRPKIGQTIFVSLYGNQPFVATITGFKYDPRFTGEQFEYIRGNGKADFSSLIHSTFYPDAPVAAPFLYLAEVEESEFMGGIETTTLEYFFSPDSAMEYLDAIAAGTVKPRYTPESEGFNYSVRVIRA